MPASYALARRGASVPSVPAGSLAQELDDAKTSYDDDGDADILDAGDDIHVNNDFGSNVLSLSYDNNGNLTDDGVLQFTYDAWNRLRKAQRVAGGDTTTIGEYEYYGDTRRSKKAVQNCGAEDVANDGGDTTVCFYYCGTGQSSAVGPVFQPVRWSIFETRNGSNQTTFQHLWGTQYTDELIWIEKNGDPTAANDTNPDNTAGGEASEDPADMRYFVHQDRNRSVIALTEYDPNDTNNGRMVERYSYTPYGSFVVLPGDSGSGELGSVALTCAIGNPFAHQGLAFDQEKLSYQNRWREYALMVQRFAQRDPHGLVLESFSPRRHYVDRRSLYVLSESNPVTYVDPTGLTPLGACCKPTRPPICGNWCYTLDETVTGMSATGARMILAFFDPINRLCQCIGSPTGVTCDYDCECYNWWTGEAAAWSCTWTGSGILSHWTAVPVTGNCWNDCVTQSSNAGTQVCP